MILLFFLRKNVVLNPWMSVVSFWWLIRWVWLIKVAVLTLSLVLGHGILILFFLDLLKFLIWIALHLILLDVLIVLALGQVHSYHFQTYWNFYGSKHVEGFVVGVIVFGWLSLFLQLKFIVLLYENWHVKNLLASWSLLWIHLEERTQYSRKVRGVMLRNFGVNSLHDSLIETFHIFCCEGWVQRHQLIQDTS